MKFCKNCKSYMAIYEKDFNNQRTIVYNCNKCNYTELPDSFCVFKKEYKQSITNDLIKNPKLIVTDNTLPRKNTKCWECKKINDNVYFQNNDLTITLVCNNCKHMWTYT